jgi:hypothetical protein
MRMREPKGSLTLPPFHVMLLENIQIPSVPRDALGEHTDSLCSTLCFLYMINKKHNRYSSIMVISSPRCAR